MHCDNTEIFSATIYIHIKHLSDGIKHKMYEKNLIYEKYTQRLSSLLVALLRCAQQQRNGNSIQDNTEKISNARLMITNCILKVLN